MHLHGLLYLADSFAVFICHVLTCQRNEARCLDLFSVFYLRHLFHLHHVMSIQ